MAPPIPRISTPSSSSSSAFTQLTYDLPHAHTYTSKFYPRPLASRPTTLSEVLVCGHESGITILWRAPASPKKVRKDASSGKSKAAAHDDDDELMVLDGPSSQAAAKDAPANGEEERSNDVDEEKFACSYTIHLGTPVHHISFPPASILPSNFDSAQQPEEEEEEDILKALPNNLLQKNILIAAACGDRSIRLITLPRDPPPTPSKKPEHVLILGAGVAGHREIASAVSLTVVPTGDTYSPPSTSPTASPSFNDPYSPPRYTSGGWDVLIASSSSDTNGVILLWRVTLLLPARGSPLSVTFKPPHRPTTIFLHSPATSLHFNTAPTSISRRHHLLISDRVGAVRILETHSRTWLSSFYTPYSPTTSRRKKLLGTEWCTGGRGIIVLCEDGEWGIWDLEGVLSKSPSATATSFLINGIVGETWFSNRRSSHHTSHDDTTSDRSPSRAMSTVSTATNTTTRRRRNIRADTSGAPGLLSVVPIPGSTPTLLAKGKAATMGGLQIHDEIVTFVFGTVILVLPSLRRFWKVEEAKLLKRSAKAGAGLGAGLWNGEDGKAEREFVVLEGWGGAGVTSVDVVPAGGEGKSARVCLGMATGVVVVNVLEAGAAKPEVKKSVGAAAGVTGIKSSFAPRTGVDGVGGSAKGKRKVGFLQ